jgi:ubiquinone/menaquinone biosynthesis C-methylase UbiE
MKHGQILMAAAFLLAACSGPANQGAGASASPQEPVAEEDDVNLDVWLERMEVGSRELYSARDAVVAAVGLREGDVIADIGAGTGLYTLLFAEAAGETGHVYSVDIEPLFLDLINRRVDDLGYDNVTSVLGRENDVSLPKESVDVVFIADTYHYFNDREEIMRSVYNTLKPGGSLIIIDYDIPSDGVRPSYASHVRFGKAGVASEMEYIGFEPAGEVDVEGLEENYFIRFKKPS